MRGIRFTPMASLALLFCAGCNKIDVDTFIDTYWTGTLTDTKANDERSDVSFKFGTGKADFVYLPYGEQYPETGVMLYEIAGNQMTIDKANETLNGIWTINKTGKETLSLTRRSDSETLKISLIKRK